MMIQAMMLLAAVQAGGDVVRLKSGAEIKGKVTAMTSATVSYTDAAGKPATQKAEDVADVVLGEPPPAFARGDAALSEGAYDKALNLFQVALDELGQNKGRPLHKQYVLYRWALALQGKGNPEEAMAMLKRLRTELGPCFLRMRSYEKSMEIAKLKGDDAVEAVLKDMKSEPEPFGSQADLELAKRRYAKDDLDGAAPIFMKLAGMTNAVGQEAKLWNLRVLRAQKKTAEVEAISAGVLADRLSAPLALVQAAAASLGKTQLPKAGTDAGKIRETLMTFALAISVGPPATKAEAEDYATALLGASKCCALLAAAATEPKPKEEYKERAVSYCREVQRAYPNTPWATAALADLAELGEEKKGGDAKDSKAPGKSE